MRSRMATQEAIDTEHERTRSCTLVVVHLNDSIKAWTEIRIGISNQYLLDEWLVPAASTTRGCASVQKASRKAGRCNNPSPRFRNYGEKASLYFVARWYSWVEQELDRSPEIRLWDAVRG